MHFFSAIRFKIPWITLEQMRLISTDDEQISRLKRVHIISNDQRTLSTDDPGYLYFNMTMEMRIKVWKLVFFDMNRASDFFRNGKLNDFHIFNMINFT